MPKYIVDKKSVTRLLLTKENSFAAMEKYKENPNNFDLVTEGAAEDVKKNFGQEGSEPISETSTSKGGLSQRDEAMASAYGFDAKKVEEIKSDAKAKKDKYFVSPEEREYAKQSLKIIDDEIANVDAQLKSMDTDDKSPWWLREIPAGTATGGGSLAPTADSEASKDLLTKKRLLRETKMYMSSTAKDKSTAMERFWDGIKTLDVPNAISFGIKDLLEGVDVASIGVKAQKEGVDALTQDEKDILVLNTIRNEAQSLASEDRAFSVGSGLAETVPFIADMMLTSGMSGMVKRGVMKGTEGVIQKEATRKILSNLSEATFGSIMRASTFPITMSGTAERMTPIVSGDIGGEIKIEKEGEGFAEAQLKSTGSSAVEVFTEAVVGNQLSKYVHRVSAKGMRILDNTKVGDVINAVSNAKAASPLKNMAAIHDPLTEFGEEVVAGILQPIITGDGSPLDFFEGENMLRVLMTTSIMSYSMSAPSIPVATMNMKRANRGESVYGGLSAQAKQSFDNLVKSDNISGMADTATELLMELSSDGSTVDATKKVNDLIGYAASIQGARAKAEKMGGKTYQVGNRVYVTPKQFLSEVQKLKNNNEDIPFIEVRNDEAVSNVVNDMLVGGVVEQSEELKNVKKEAPNVKQDAEVDSQKAETETLEQQPTDAKEAAPKLKDVEIKIDNQGEYGKVSVFYKGDEVSFNSFILNKPETGINKKGESVQFVSVMDVNKSKNKGLGKLAYIQLGKTLANEGIILTSSNTRMKGGEMLWDNLVKEGYAGKTATGYMFKSSLTEGIQFKEEAPTTDAATDAASEGVNKGVSDKSGGVTINDIEAYEEKIQDDIDNYDRRIAEEETGRSDLSVDEVDDVIIELIRSGRYVEPNELYEKRDAPYNKLVQNMKNNVKKALGGINSDSIIKFLGLDGSAPTQLRDEWLKNLGRKIQKKDKDFSLKLQRLISIELANEMGVDFDAVMGVGSGWGEKKKESFISNVNKIAINVIESLVNSSSVEIDGASVGIVKGVNKGVSEGVKETKPQSPQKVDEKETQSSQTSEAPKSFKEVDGGERVYGEIQGIYEKSDKRKVSFAKKIENAISYLQGTKAYENATDTQREAMVRDIRADFKLKEKKAPPVKKILGVKDKKIVVNEKAALKDQIRLEAKAARESKSDQDNKRRAIGESISGLVKKGKINTKQANAIINRLSRTNLNNQKHVEKLINYLDKVFSSADAADKLKRASDQRKAIGRGAKRTTKGYDVKDTATRFAAINEELVDDIDAYLANAERIRAGLEATKKKGTDVTVGGGVKIDEANTYITEQLKKQKEYEKQLDAQYFYDTTGVDPSDLSYDEMRQILDSPKEDSDKQQRYLDNKQKLIRDSIKKFFSYHAGIIKKMIDTGSDVFTGNSINIDANKKAILRDFMEMDLDAMTIKDAMRALDAMNNFIVNGNVGGMEAAINKNKGYSNANKIKKEGIKAQKIKLLFSGGLGRKRIAYLGNLPSLFELQFRGVNAAIKVMDAMGLSDFMNGANKAVKKRHVVVEEYVKKFNKKKPNGMSFNSAENIYERAMYATLRRTPSADAKEIQAEFDRNKENIKKSIENLRKGDDKEKRMAELYQKVYDRILKDSKNIADVEGGVDATNIDAVNYITDTWASVRGAAQSLSENLYNRIFNGEEFYNPITYRRTSYSRRKVTTIDAPYEKQFDVQSTNVEPEESSVLKEIDRTKPMANDSYISLDFDSDFNKKYGEFLMDFNTAAAQWQIKGFLDSDAFNDIYQNKEDAELAREWIKSYVDSKKKKSRPTDNDMRRFIKMLNVAGGFVGARVLGQARQVLKQTIPVAVNTIINAGRLDIHLIANKSAMDFIDKSGYSISNRGLGSSANIESAFSEIGSAIETKTDKALDKMNKINSMWLNLFLVKPDVAIARASWLSYYMGNLPKGERSNIDWATHKINKKAADFAEMMVSRQQNISDEDLGGKLYTDKSPAANIIRKVVFPFSNFVLNQKTRMYNDFIVALSNSASKEDRVIAARSLIGMTTEILTFNAVSAYLGYVVRSIAQNLIGSEPDEEDIKKAKAMAVKSTLTNLTTDFFSPIPPTDGMVIGLGNLLIDAFQDEEALEEEGIEPISLYTRDPQSEFDTWGAYGMGINIVKEGAEISDMAFGETYIKKSKYGQTEKVLNEDYIGDVRMANWMYWAYVAGLLPKEFGDVARQIARTADKESSSVKKK
jgi:hypothetical protein